MTTNAELAQQVRQLAEKVEQLVDQVQVKTFTVADPLTGEVLTGPAVVLEVDDAAGVAYVAPLTRLGVPVPLDQLH